MVVAEKPLGAVLVGDGYLPLLIRKRQNIDGYAQHLRNLPTGVNVDRRSAGLPAVKQRQAGIPQMQLRQ
jgi:hypothetical protein